MPMFEDQVSTNPLRTHLCTNTRCLTRMLTIRSCVCYAAHDLTATYKGTVVQGGGECTDTTIQRIQPRNSMPSGDADRFSRFQRARCRNSKLIRGSITLLQNHFHGINNIVDPLYECLPFSKRVVKSLRYRCTFAGRPGQLALHYPTVVIKDGKVSTFNHKRAS